MSTNNRVVTFGEVMLRLSPPGYLRLLQTTTLEMTFGGAEANVAVSLALLGMEAAFITRLPKNDIADAFIAQVRGLGVDTRSILRGGDRIGVYFVEKGASQRASTVLYDRAHSAIAEINPDDLNWDRLLEGATAFHFTGITPALSDNAARAARMGAEAARNRGIFVSCDLNYRKKLWSREKAGAVMGELLPFVDLCIANEEDCESVFGISAEGSDLTGGTLDHERYRDVAAQMTDRFGLKEVAITLRESINASRNGWSGMLYADGTPYFSRRYEIDIVDRVGGGDSFAAGLLFARLNGRGPAEAIEFAAAASCLKHTVVGDFNFVKLAEVENLLKGDGSGRVQR
ncbi:MAG: sugar kinase [Capsulimonadales bacterium]|nr:sugar kinase [Capsulimonadales bacterium]